MYLDNIIFTLNYGGNRMKLLKTMMAVLLLSSVLLEAQEFSDKEISKGKSAYLKMCKKCHGNGTKGAAMNTQMDWEEMFDYDAELIIEKHQGTKAEKFFKSKRFKKYAPYLKAFLYHYGSDSGNVPSCG